MHNRKLDQAAPILIKDSSYFAEPVFLGVPNIADRASLLERIGQVLDSKMLSNCGPMVREFERRIERYLGVKHCIVVANATIGLELTAKALELSGEVIVPSFTFVATPHSILRAGGVPVFCDVDPETHTIDPEQVEKLITKRTKGIMPVHLWGNSCDVKALEDIARRHDLKILYDAAHAFGSSVDGKMIGGFGDAEVFSFHATKILNTFEGGAVTTNSDEVARRVRQLSTFGLRPDDDVDAVGTNAKMSEISAAMGLVSMERLPEWIERNERCYDVYREELEGIIGLKLFTPQAGQRGNFHYVPVEIDEQAFGMSREGLLEMLKQNNVMGKRYFYPGCHRFRAYRKLAVKRGPLPVTERLTEEVLCLPTAPAVNEASVRSICMLIRKAHRRAAVMRAYKAWGGSVELTQVSAD